MILPLLFAVLTPNPSYVQDTVDRWKDLDIEVTVVSHKCRFDNAAYWPGTKVVELCSDLFDRPELTRFILNHELAHAFNRQHGIDWGDDEEFKADELAFFMSDDDEVMAGIQWFLDSAGEGLAGKDIHPADLDRAAMLICLDDGLRGEDRQCGAYYRSAMAAWSLIVNSVD